MRCALIKIDLTRLTHRLRASEGRWLNERELREWLGTAGFVWSSGSWFVCSQADVGLRGDEIIERQTRETSDGITYIEREPQRNTRPAAG